MDLSPSNGSRKPQMSTNYRPTPSLPRKRPADSQEQAWIKGEDRFVINQAKKRSLIRVREGRAKPIDYLAITLRFIDHSQNPFEDEISDSDLEVVDPEGVLEGLDKEQLDELVKDVDTFLTLENNEKSRQFWDTIQVICKDRQNKASGDGRGGRGVDSISSDVEKLFSTKSIRELEKLESQIKGKLNSNEPIDVEYWEHLLRNLISWKARAKLRTISQAVIDSQLKGLREQQQEEANRSCKQLSVFLSEIETRHDGVSETVDLEMTLTEPEPALKIQPSNKHLSVMEEGMFLNNIASEQRKVLRSGYIPPKGRKRTSENESKNGKNSMTASNRHDEPSRATTLLYEREVARGVGENEEVFTGEEEVFSNSKGQLDGNHNLRKPRYFNRVQMGYEWNKYNQTHYDHDNPPPKVVQGYKFNILYPDLIDKQTAPTYKIERENGRKRGQSFAPAGEEDTCLIRFIAGPPYEDIAFRIVDKEWDFSAKRERGFRSSFDKGVLTLWFQFKKVFYRK